MAIYSTLIVVMQQKLFVCRSIPMDLQSQQVLWTIQQDSGT